MSLVDCQEQVETSTKWCNSHKTKSYFKLFDCPLFFLFWPELPILLPDASREPSEEVFELCELCGQSYKPGSLPVEGLQVGVTKVMHEEFEDGSETSRRSCHVTFAPHIAVESGLFVNNGSNGEEEDETEERKLIRGSKINGIVTNLKKSEEDKLAGEYEGDYNSEDEEPTKTKCLPFRKKNN